MSWQTDQLRYSLGMGTLVTFYGFVSLVIFVAGDRFGLDLSYKIVVIAIVLLTLPFALVIGFFATRKKKVKPEDAAAEGSDVAQTEGNQVPPPRTTTPNGKYAELNESADVAFKFLQSSNLAGTTGKEAIYALPFFVFAGTPRSGKTSLVQSSNLDFQTLPNQRQSEQNFIRPTKSVDWRVTNDAVLLDTAGRYQLEGIDGEEFSAFIEILKKQRGNRPLDGFVLTVNAAKLVGADEAEIEQQAKTLRARLDETMQRTKIKFPVYLVFTNADSIEGFRDSFSISQQEGKNLIVGTTFPLEKCEIAHSLFDSEFEALQSSFIKRRLLRLSAPFPPARQLRIFNFPAHFSSSRRKFGQFVATLFRPNPFNENPMFRGFYFTAAIPQVQQERGAGENAATVKTIAASYFAERFFHDVLLRDKNLVATFQAQKVRQPLLGWLMILIGTFLTIGLLAMSIVSTFYNKQMLQDASAKAEEVLLINTADKGRDVLTKNSTEARNEVEATDKLRQITAKLDDYERNGAPIYMRFGMYSGGQILHERLLPIYFAAIEQRYKKPVVKRLEENLRTFAANQNALNSANLTDEQEKELGKNYDLLKAYLMLSGEYSKYSEPIFVQKQLKDLWKKSAPSELEAVSDEQLAFYSSQIDREEFPRIAVDANLVAASRKRLQAYPAVFRYYKRITTETDKKIEPISVESVLAGRSAGQLEGSEKVPGSYTMEGYRGEMQKAILNAQTELSKEDWVMGEQANNPNNAAITNDEIAKLQERYFNDYTDNWRRFVRGIRVTKATNKTEIANSLKSFSATESPMEIVVREIAINTNFSAKPKTTDWYSWFMSFFQKTSTSKVETSNEVEREFKPLFVFMGDDTKPDSAPIALYRADLRKLVEPIEGASNDQIKQITQDLAADKDSIGLRKVESSVNSRVENFTTSAAQEISNLLKKPVQNVRSFFGAGANDQIDKAWREQILPKATEIQNGYPFNDVGEADLPKLTAFLNPVNGTLTTFYNERLSKYFEEANGQIKLKDGSDVKFNDDFIAYLNSAFKLRDAMFGKNATPSFEYELKLQPSKEAIFEVQIDGQKIDSSGTSSTKFSFPAKSGVETGAILQLSSTADSVSTSAANKNANVALANTATVANTSSNSNLSNVNALPTPTPTAMPTPKPAKVAPTPVPVQPLKFSGQWGLFKMVDAGTPSKNANGEYALSYKFGAKSVVAIVKPTGGDLFDKSLFRNVKAPSNILK